MEKKKKKKKKKKKENLNKLTGQKIIIIVMYKVDYSLL